MIPSAGLSFSGEILEEKYSADKNYELLMDIYQRAIALNRAEN